MTYQYGDSALKWRISHMFAHMSEHVDSSQVACHCIETGLRSEDLSMRLGGRGLSHPIILSPHNSA
jgi:hypothetical protein